MLDKLNKIFKLQDGLKARTLVAAFWSLIGSAGRGGIRLTSNLILTRILVPEDFGLMATAMVVVTLIQIFSDTGVKTALVQNPRGSETVFINNSFIIAIGRSLLLVLLLLIIRSPMAQYYSLPALEPILLVLSLAIIIEGFLNPALPILIKKLDIKKQVMYSVGSQFIGFVLTVALALTFRSVMALAVGYTLTSLSRLIISYLVYPFRPRLQWDSAVGLELFHFGKYIMLNTLVTWTALNLDRLIIGKVLGMEKLGIYNIALYLGVFASDILVQVFAQSYFPAMSSIAQDLKKVSKIYVQTARTTILIATPILLTLAMFSNTLVELLYDSRYQVAGTVLFWIALRSMVQTLNHIQSGTLLALGKPLEVTIGNSLGLVMLFLTLPAFSTKWGLVGGGIALLINMLLMTAVQSFFLVKKVGFSVQMVLRPWTDMILITLGFAGAVYGASSLVKSILEGSSIWALLLIVAHILIALTLLAKIWTGRKLKLDGVI